MRVYADANFFIALYCGGPHHTKAMRLHAAAVASGAEAYPVCMIGRLEFINALQQTVFSTRHGVSGIRLTPEWALVIEATFFKDIASGERLCEAMLHEPALEAHFQTLSHRHTARSGFRTYDLLHVSCALTLGCDTFWSFDAKAKKLAVLEGLEVN
jgi:predicted nucleic acid-binding protein